MVWTQDKAKALMRNYPENKAGIISGLIGRFARSIDCVLQK
ncbi:Unannotated [Lentimonas sp. CC4]|nr:Unannotated [Lentimonas sp. CC4]CAA6685631.1 Unannotated [Lentimonas sp. CC6]CAA7077076.1 Unannotated [Lentimonas sp. CC4]CAA7168843.1 Unannotated [Lentimonas sp. CC21]CAA7180794.1 Unannotated [Lentimonas sp. CC8]